MKRIGTRLVICLLLVSLLAVTVSAASLENCPGSCAHQAAVDTTHYDTLAEALTAADAGKTVTLLADITLSAPVTAEKSVALDLGGHTLTGNLIFTGDGTIRNGKLIAADGIGVLADGCTLVIEKDAHLEGCGTAPALAITADKDEEALVKVSGKISGADTAPVILAESLDGSCALSILKNAELTADTNPVISFDSEGKLEIADGTLQGKKDLITVHIAKDRKTEISVTGGKLLSKEGEVIVFTAEEGAEIPKDFVTGGTYNTVPTAYVPAYCRIIKNTDGTGTVISSYTLTFLSGGASGSMKPVTVQCSSSYSLPKPGFTPAEGMEFVGWLIGSKTYAAGSSFTPDADTTVTAQWKTHVHYGGNATCLSKAVCAGCGKAYGQYGSHKLTYSGGYAAACDKTGMQAHHKCSVCGGRFVNGMLVSSASLSIPAPGHVWENVESIPATCTEDGLQAHRICSTCNALQIDGKPAEEADLLIPAVGHTLETVDASQATCSQPGIQAHEHCTVCDQLFVQDKVVDTQALTIALSSHVLSDWQNDETYHWKACVDCDEVFRQSRHADKDTDGSCDDCGFVMAAEENDPADEDEPAFSWLFLIPILAAVVIAILLIFKKRK